MRKDYFEKEFKIKNFEEELKFDNKTVEELWAEDFELKAPLDLSNSSSTMMIINGTAVSDSTGGISGDTVLDPDETVNIVYPNSVADRTDVYDTLLAVLDSLQVGKLYF